MGLLKRKSKTQEKKMDLAIDMPKQPLIKNREDLEKQMQQIQQQMQALEPLPPKKEPANMEDLIQLLADHVNQSKDSEFELYTILANLLNKTENSPIVRMGILSMLQTEVGMLVLKGDEVSAS